VYPFVIEYLIISCFLCW